MGSNKKVFTLLEVTKSIRKTIAERYQSTYWIKAEMNKLNHYSHSGHCYPELVEKENGKVIAQIKSILWKDDYRNINNNFLKVLKEPLKEGIKILFLARISFDPIHGLALQIIDIDPAYTLGDLEKEKQDTINSLKEEGIFDRNKTLQIPLLPQRIAIISVESSKGYADFLGVLESNSWNYQFFHMLFPSLLQGEKAVESIITQLKRIEKVKSHFDVVAIIRGGGGDVGLSCYNQYELAKAIALFPIPVITGIGHATNETVAEIISFSNAITPTKIAEYLLQKFHNFSVPVQKAQELIIDKSRRMISDARTVFQQEIKLLRSLTENILTNHRNQIKEQTNSLARQSLFVFKNENDYVDNLKEGIKKAAFTYCGSARQEVRSLTLNLKKDVSFQLINKEMQINSMEKNIINMSPQNVLKRGYSITLHNQKAVKSFQELKVNDEIETILFDGKIHSIVKSSQESPE